MGGSIVGAVDLYFVLCARELYVGGNIIGAVDLQFVSCARELYVGGSIVGAVDLYFISCARVICGREYNWSGYIWAGVLLERLIYILYYVRASYLWAGILLQRLIYILYYVRASYMWAGILLERLYMGGSIVGTAEIYFVSRARELEIWENIVRAIDDINIYWSLMLSSVDD